MISGRWKVACINWPHPDAPHAMSYLLVDGEARFEMFHDTWQDAMNRVAVWDAAYPFLRDNAEPS